MSKRYTIFSKSDNDSTFLGHIEALRYTLIRSVIVITIISIAAFFFKDFIYNQIILAPKDEGFISNILFCKFGHLFNTELLCINKNDFEIINIELAGQFRSHLLVTVIAGLILSFPYLLLEIWWFIKPALYSTEKKGVGSFVVVTSILFLIGVLFGYYVIDPLTINFLSNYVISDDVINQIKLGSYISTVVMISLSTGLVFELPVLIYFLSRFGIVTPGFLKKYRKHAILVFFILSAIITPPDVFSQILVAIPLILLYEVSIIISKRVDKRRKAKEKE
ncbi:MAG: twin-arginine translocase subunit TatC [Saprospiraceae bacterium]|nr:twin-arginine translocase subunit TatC [Saprospiraceae bacterium]